MLDVEEGTAYGVQVRTPRFGQLHWWTRFGWFLEEEDGLERAKRNLVAAQEEFPASETRIVKRSVSVVEVET